MKPKMAVDWLGRESVRLWREEEEEAEALLQNAEGTKWASVPFKLTIFSLNDM